jgi:transmembrane sensor
MSNSNSNSNKIISLHSSNSIDDEASLWLVRLDNGDLSQQLRNELKHWLAADIKHQQALTAMATVWDDIDESLAIVNDEKLSASFSILDICTPLLKPILVAASVCFICIFAFINSSLNIQKNTYATVIGEQMQTTFDDGSIIHLNTNSHIETEFSADKRMIKLIHGEALFDVAHDPDRPFIVYVGDRLVQAIGTKFVIHLKSENVEVTVTDGKVVMSKINADQRLQDIRKIDTATIKPDDIFITKDHQALAMSGQTPTLLAVEANNIERSLAWLDGKMVFNNEKLFDVITEVNRYIDQEILLNDALLREIRISGRFDLGDSEALIEALTLSFDIKSQRTGDNKILLSKSVKVST